MAEELGSVGNTLYTAVFSDVYTQEHTLCIYICSPWIFVTESDSILFYYNLSFYNNT